MKLAESYQAQLWRFVRHVLVPTVPRLAWWALGLLVLSSLNLLFQREVWPHHPQAEKLFTLLLVASMALLPWLAAYTAQQLASHLQHWWWRGLWWLVAAGGYVGAGILSIILLIGALISGAEYLP